MIQRVIGALFAAALITSACGESTKPAEIADIETGDGFGSYDVGVETITIADATGGDRDLTVEVWFPLGDNADLTPWRESLPGDLFLESTHAFVATRDAISADGPFPLVIYSHGDGAARTTDSNYTEAIASHGYVVAAPDHRGNTCCDAPDPKATVLLNRPHDVSAVIDAMVDPNRSETAGFVDHVNADQIAVTGFQGFTAYAAASGFDNRRGEYVADDRIGAIIALSPDLRQLEDARLASIEIPSLLMIGTEDRDASADRPWELSNSSPSYRVDIVGGEHLSFSIICAYVALLDANPDADAGGFRNLMNSFRSKGCEPDDFPYERAQAITNTFATTFLDSVFRGSEPIHPDQVAGLSELIYQVK